MLVAEENVVEPINLDPLDIVGSPPAIDFPLNAPLKSIEFDEDTVNQLGFDSARDAADYVPNFNLMDAGSSGFADRSNMRGLASTPLYTSPAIVLYVDDVPYLSSFSSSNQLINTDSIEVFQGSQGGLFGKNSYAGVINVKSRRPTNQFQGQVSVDKGNFDSLNIKSQFSGALVKNRLFFSLGTAYSERDGYVDNTFLNQDTDFQQHLSGKMALLWTPNENWEFDIKAGVHDFNDGAPRVVSLQNSNIYKVKSNEPGNQDKDANNQSLKITYTTESFQLFSMTARRDSDTAHTIDLDFSPQPFLKQQLFFKQQQWTQEFRLKSLLESDWRGSVGLFFSDNDVSGDISNDLANVSINQKIRTLDESTYAVFGQLSYQGFDALRIFLDLRLDYTEKNINRSLKSIFNTTTQLKEQRSDFFFSPKLTLDYAFTPQTSIYASTGLAFKPGGFSARSEAFPEFDKETLWASEIGIKSMWLNQRVNTDVSLFYYDIEDYQLEDFFTIFDYSVINAPEVISYGGEINLALKITDNLTISGFAGYSHTEFKRYTDPFSNINYRGNKVPYIPSFNANISGQYRHPSGFYARTDLIWTGKTYFDAANTDTYAEQDYRIVNAQVGYKRQHFNITAYVNNISNEQYFSYKIPIINLGVPSEPRTFGMRAGLAF